jgi:Mn-dependent DtxR family transcriptional regulator
MDNITLRGFKMDEEYKKILKIIYESNKKNPSYQVDNNYLIEKLDVKPDELVTITNYLEGERYIKIEPYLDGFEVNITPRGRKLVEKWD